LGLGERSAGRVFVGDDLDLSQRTDREIAQHVAGGERGQQHVFGIGKIRVAPIGRIGRATDRRLAFDLDAIFA